MSFPDGMGIYSGMPVKSKFDVKGKIKDKLKNLKREKRNSQTDASGKIIGTYTLSSFEFNDYSLKGIGFRIL